MARIDIIMPVRNGAAYLDEAIRSVRAQNARDWRLLVLDHGSGDTSAAIAARHAGEDARVELRDCSAVQGLSVLRNVGLDAADGEFVLLHDADDRSRPDRIDRLIEGLTNNPGATAIGSECRLVDEQGRASGYLSRLIDAARISPSILFCNPMAQPTVMFRREGLARHKVCYGTGFLGVVSSKDDMIVTDLVEDYLLFGQLGILGECVNLPLPLVDYRRHPQSVTMLAHRRQLQLSLAVSRFLMHSLAGLRSVPYVDPAPFCSHGATLFALPERSADLDVSFKAMAASLRQAFGPSAALERELAFRRTLATRQSFNLATRYLQFRARHRPEMDEAAVARGWLTAPLRGRQRPIIEADDLLPGMAS